MTEETKRGWVSCVGVYVDKGVPLRVVDAYGPCAFE